jgi:hypothetical protein
MCWADDDTTTSGGHRCQEDDALGSGLVADDGGLVRALASLVWRPGVASS